MRKYCFLCSTCKFSHLTKNLFYTLQMICINKEVNSIFKLNIENHYFLFFKIDCNVLHFQGQEKAQPYLISLFCNGLDEIGITVRSDSFPSHMCTFYKCFQIAILLLTWIYLLTCEWAFKYIGQQRKPQS